MRDCAIVRTPGSGREEPLFYNILESNFKNQGKKSKGMCVFLTKF